MPQSPAPSLKDVVKAFKSAEYANRKAARTFASFIAKLESLGIRVELTEQEVIGDAKDRDSSTTAP